MATWSTVGIPATLLATIYLLSTVHLYMIWPKVYMVNGNMYIIFSNAFVSELGDSMVDILFLSFCRSKKMPQDFYFKFFSFKLQLDLSNSTTIQYLLPLQKLHISGMTLTLCDKHIKLCQKTLTVSFRENTLIGPNHV